MKVVVLGSGVIGVTTAYYLARAGAQVLDLEALASHRASVLGLIPGHPQPSQKRFEMLVWETLRAFDPARRTRFGPCCWPRACWRMSWCAWR